MWCILLYVGGNHVARIGIRHETVDLQQRCFLCSCASKIRRQSLDDMSDMMCDRFDIATVVVR